MKKLSTRKWHHPEGYKYLAPYSNAVLLRFLIRTFTERLSRAERRRKDQLDDAGRSVISNIEEGYKRPTTKEYLTFLGFSQGSLEEIKGLVRQAHQDGLLKGKVGSSLKDIKIDLKEFKGKVEEDKGNTPLNVLYAPLASLKVNEMTFEMMMELVNKTDYLLRQLTAALEQSVTKEDSVSPLEKWRWRQIEAKRKKEGEFDSYLKEVRGSTKEHKGKTGEYKEGTSRSGQSLVEVVIGLAIGAILMGTAAFAVTTMLRTNLTSEKSQFASQFAQSLSDNVRSFVVSNWGDLYGLTKGTSTHYFLNASGTTFLVVQGEEGLLDGDVPDGLVGQWKFDEVETATSTTTYDATGSGNHGTLSGGTARASSTCKAANCMYFDGSNDQISLGSGTQYDSASFSIAMWIRPVQLSGTGAHSNIFLGRENYLNSGFRAGVAGSSALGRVEFWTAQSGGTLTLTSGSTRVATTTGSFYHVVVTYASSTSNGVMYLDGVQVGSSTGSYVVPVSQTLVIDGGIGGVTSLNAYMDDVRWYNRALSADEVRQLWNSGVYKRFFTVENVCRTNNASSTIASKAPCSGTVEDGSTQWITNYAQWTTGAGTSEVTLPAIVARWQNAVFRQTDWSGGAASEGAVAEPTSKFSSSTNASTTGGSLQIQNLSQQ